MQIVKKGTICHILADKGYWLTQSFPTMFPTFTTSITLASPDAVGDWKEVTQREKEVMENACLHLIEDGGGKRTALTPLYESISKYVKFNDATGYYKVLGIEDVTESRMALIYDNFTSEMGSSGNVRRPEARAYVGVVNMFYSHNPPHTTMNLSTKFCSTSVEEIRLADNSEVWVDSTAYAFANCNDLRKIYNNIKVAYNAKNGTPSKFHTNTFLNTPKLEYLHVVMEHDLDLHTSKALTEESIKWILDHAVILNSLSHATLTLHPDAFARVTDEMFETASSKRITIATS